MLKIELAIVHYHSFNGEKTSKRCNHPLQNGGRKPTFLEQHFIEILTITPSLWLTIVLYRNQ